jgi:hypothetical protein
VVFNHLGQIFENKRQIPAGSCLLASNLKELTIIILYTFFREKSRAWLNMPYCSQNPTQEFGKPQINFQIWAFWDII